jgi:hypothetical protein
VTLGDVDTCRLRFLTRTVTESNEAEDTTIENVSGKHLQKLEDRTYHHFGERIKPMNEKALYETCIITRPYQFSTLFLLL